MASVAAASVAAASVASIKMNAIKRFQQLGGYTPEAPFTRFVNAAEFTDEYADLKLGNGGGWCRFDGPFAKKFKAVKVKTNGAINYSWESTPAEVETINAELQSYMTSSNKTFSKGNDIFLLKIAGSQNIESSQAIREDIKAALRTKRCPVLWTSFNIEIDHKNGRKNDPRVMCTATQLPSDFQALSKAANDAKRQHCITCKATGVRFDAKQLGHKISITEGSAEFGDEKNPNGCIGCYWYDIEDFNKKM